MFILQSFICFASNLDSVLVPGPNEVHTSSYSSNSNDPRMWPTGETMNDRKVKQTIKGWYNICELQHISSIRHLFKNYSPYLKFIEMSMSALIISGPHLY